MPYAWMLATYPRDYRRRHGAELLEPMLAESRRPTVREAVNLFAHGLRTRLGRSASRAVLAWALLALVTAGVFGAALGSWVGWQTARPLPQPAWTRALLADVVPGRDFGRIEEPPSSTFVLWDRDLRWHDADDLLFGRGGEYQATSAGALAQLPPGADLDALAGQASDRLAAAGWTVRPPARGDVTGCAGLPCDPQGLAQWTRFEATRDGLALALEVNPAQAGQAATVSVAFQRTTPAGAWVGGAAGGLTAAAAGFLVFAWASRRTGHPGHPARLAVVFPFGVAMLFWWTPVLAWEVMAAPFRPDRPGAAGPPLWEWLGQPTYSLSFLIGAGFAVLALSLAALPHRPELQRAAPAGPGPWPAGE
jgi:hypothetical protein